MKHTKPFLHKAFGIMLTFFFIIALSTAGMAADAYPSKPVRLIVPFPPGGSNDIVGRLIGAKLSERLGQQVVVENHGGAGGSLGSELAAKSTPDGYTLLIVSAAFAINTSLYKLPYDPYKDFAPVSLLGKGPNVLAVHPSVPAKSVKELLALAKAKPGQLICAAAGVGSFQHMGTELFKAMAGIDFMIVQFKGGGPSMTDLLGGHSNFALGSLIQFIPHFKSGKLIALGTGGSKRSSILPDVPTIAEAGVPGYESSNWWGILAPAGTPQPIINRLNKEIAVILDQDETKKMFEQQGADAESMSPGEFESYIKTETEKWGKVVKAANIKVEN
ncbi:MAG: tripartite tricarboxylate transporter substrate binding protein [Thermodesulfobacteriota bacterium]